MASPRIILITRTGCGPCANFLAGPWRTLKDRLSYAVGSTNAVEHIDVARDGMDKIPNAIRKQLQFVPQIFAFYSDGVVEVPKNPINSPQGIQELNEWTGKGPPRYASTSSTIEAEGDEKSRWEVLAITSSGCPHCIEWETSGKMQRFLDSLPPSVRRSHFNVPPGPPLNAEDRQRRMALTGINVPATAIVDHQQWKHPGTSGPPPTVLRSPMEVRDPEGLVKFNRWLSLLTQDGDQPFLGYMILSTSSSCGHCIAWKESGGMDQFINTNKSLPGILLVHNGYLSPQIASQIRSVPSVFFVSASDWSRDSPELIPGPDPRDTEAVAKWVAELEEGRWSNDSQYVPDTYRAGAARKALTTTARSRRPVQRQKFPK